MRFIRLIVLSVVAISAISCRLDSQVLAEFNGGDVRRSELRAAFRLMEGQPSLEMQDRVVTDLALLKITALEAVKQGLDQTEDFKKREPLFHKLAFLGSLEQELMAEQKKQKFKMMELQFAFLKEGEKDKKRKPEAEDIAKKLNEASDSDREKIIAQKTEMKRYAVTGGYADPICVSCVPNPFAFLTDAAAKAEGKFVVVDDPNGFWIIRKAQETEVSGDSLSETYEAYFKKAARLSRTAIAAMPEGAEKKEMEAQTMKEAQIETVSKQIAEQQVKRESQGLLQKRIEQRKKSLGLEALPGLRSYFDEKTDVAKDLSAPAIKMGGKDITLGELLQGLPEDKTVDRRQLLQQIVLPYEILKEDPLAAAALKSPQHDFLMAWNRNNQLAVLFLGKQNLPEITEAQVLERFNAGFAGQNFGQLHDRIKADLTQEMRQGKLKQIQDGLGKQYNLKINKDKLKGGEL
ncbi:MAG TPA: hypothetical protein PKX74_00765 [Leptospiraceae bacterium]|nr:hypothetical protein [Leptospiraceae bacterium]HMZ38135.1 hypothetical protein [Leptospiraceae bacterium]